MVSSKQKRSMFNKNGVDEFIYTTFKFEKSAVDMNMPAAKKGDNAGVGHSNFWMRKRKNVRKNNMKRTKKQRKNNRNDSNSKKRRNNRRKRDYKDGYRKR